MKQQRVIFVDEEGRKMTIPVPRESQPLSLVANSEIHNAEVKSTEAIKKPPRLNFRVLDTDSDAIAPDRPPSTGKTVEEWAKTHADFHRRKKFWKTVSGDLILGPDFPVMSGTTFKVLAYILLFVDYGKKSKKHGRTIKKSTVLLPRNALKERGISESSRKRAIKELEDLGYIERLPVKNRYKATEVTVLKGL